MKNNSKRCNQRNFFNLLFRITEFILIAIVLLYLTPVLVARANHDSNLARIPTLVGLPLDTIASTSITSTLELHREEESFSKTYPFPNTELLTETLRSALGLHPRLVFIKNLEIDDNWAKIEAAIYLDKETPDLQFSDTIYFARWNILGYWQFLHNKSFFSSPDMSDVPPKWLSDIDSLVKKQKIYVPQADSSNVYYLPYPEGISYQVTSDYDDNRCDAPAYCAHAAIDFGMGSNNIVVAASGGKVIAVNWNSDSGACSNTYANLANYLKIQHPNGEETWYWHLAYNSIPSHLRTINAVVTQGEMVGLSGATGWSCGAHLHFASWNQGMRNPRFIEGGNTTVWYPQTLTSQNQDMSNPSGTTICDNDDSCWSSANWWGFATGAGYGNDVRWTFNEPNPISASSIADWRPTISTDSMYEVLFRNPFYDNGKNETQHARYEIHHADGITQKEINQQAYNIWTSLGIYRFTSGTSGFVRLRDDTGETSQTTSILADVIKFVPKEPQIVLVIDEPSQNSERNGDLFIRGWSIDETCTVGTGVNGIHIYRDGPAGQGTFVGIGNYGQERGDIASLKGERFRPSGWNLTANTIQWGQGSHTLYIYSHSSCRDYWQIETRTINITIQVGQGSSRQTTFQTSWNVNNGLAAMGNPINTVYWWSGTGTNWSRAAVTRQDMASINGRGSQSIIHDEGADSPAGTVRAFTIYGGILDAFMGTSSAGYLTTGAPTSDQFGRCGNPSQSFDNGYILWNNGNPAFASWNENQLNWKVEFWNNKAMLAGRTFVGSYASINFDWAQTAPTDSNGCAIGLFPDQFSMRATRTVFFPQGPYVFRMENDDGARLYIDNVLVIDSWTDQAVVANFYTTTFPSAGNHTIRMEYYENGGNAVAKLSWASTDTIAPNGGITSPPNGTVTNNPNFVIQATATDPAILLVSQDEAEIKADETLKLTGLITQAVLENGEVWLTRDFSEFFTQLGWNSVSEETSQAKTEFGHDDHWREWQSYISRPHPSVNTLRAYFDDAAKEFDVPSELLQAIAAVETNWVHIGPSIDGGWGMMHLTDNNYSHTLQDAAELLKTSAQKLKDDPHANIRGGAALLRNYADEMGIVSHNLVDWFKPAAKFSALITSELRNMQAQEYFKILANGSVRHTLWDETITIRSSGIDAPKTSQLEIVNTASADYPAASYEPTNCYYTGRTHTLDTWTNHWIGVGTVDAAISRFKNCSQEASAHFIVMQSGDIIQMVRTSDAAWHSGGASIPDPNQRSIGVEHDVIVTNPDTWNTEALLRASANMARYFADLYGIPKVHRTGPTDEGGIRGHTEMGIPTQCPGNLPWTTWMTYLNENASDTIVDDGDSGFTTTGAWNTSTSNFYGVPCAYNGDAKWVLNMQNNSSAAATWTPSLVQSGVYEVIVHLVAIDNGAADTSQARYQIHNILGDNQVTLVQNNRYCEWQSLGQFAFNAGTSGYVQLVNATGESDGTRSLIVDAVRFKRVGSLPSTPTPTPTSAPTVITSPSVASGINRVEFYATYNGATNLICTDTASPYSCNWNASAIPDQSIIFSINIYDNAGNVTISAGGTRTVLLDRTSPTGNITSPSGSITTSSYQINMTASASDTTGGSGVNRTEFYAQYDGSWHLLCADYAAPYTCTWNNRGVNNQGAILAIYVIDNAGNRALNAGGYRYVTLQHHQVFVPSTQRSTLTGW